MTSDLLTEEEQPAKPDASAQSKIKQLDSLALLFSTGVLDQAELTAKMVALFAAGGGPAAAQLQSLGHLFATGMFTQAMQANLIGDLPSDKSDPDDDPGDPDDD